MKRLVVDASVAMKWYAPEHDSIRAIAVLESVKHGVALHAPELIYAEFGNILWKKQKRGELPKSEIGSILNMFTDVPLVASENRVLLPGALEIAMATGRTLYDSLYVALAEEIDAKVVTADRKLVNALAATPWSAYVLDLEHFAGLN